MKSVLPKYIMALPNSTEAQVRVIRGVLCLAGVCLCTQTHTHGQAHALTQSSRTSPSRTKGNHLQRWREKREVLVGNSVGRVYSDAPAVCLCQVAVSSSHSTVASVELALAHACAPHPV